MVNHGSPWLTDGRTVGRLDGRTVGRSDGRTVGPSDGRTVGRTVGPSDGRTIRGSDGRTLYFCFPSTVYLASSTYLPLPRPVIPQSLSSPIFDVCFSLIATLELKGSTGGQKNPPRSATGARGQAGLKASVEPAGSPKSAESSTVSASAAQKVSRVLQFQHLKPTKCREFHSFSI